MANSKEIGSWLIANSKHLGLSVKNATWIKEWLPEHHNIYVEINVNGISTSGSSIDKSSDLAFIKAGAEAIERLVCIQNNIHSNGVAAHVDFDKAKNNAKFELLERDSFLSHFVCKEAFITPKKELLENPLFGSIKSKLERLGIELKIVKLKTARDYYGFACFCLPMNGDLSFSSVIGLGYSDDPTSSLSKAIFECLPSMVWHISEAGNEKKLTQSSFYSLKTFSPEDHRDLFLGDSYKQEIREIVEHITTKEMFDATNMTFKFEQLESTLDFINKSPIKVVKANSKDAQSIYYGPTDISLLNIKRLQNFTGKSINTDELNLMPHCLG